MHPYKNLEGSFHPKTHKDQVVHLNKTKAEARAAIIKYPSKSKLIEHANTLTRGLIDAGERPKIARLKVLAALEIKESDLKIPTIRMADSLLLNAYYYTTPINKRVPFLRLFDSPINEEVTSQALKTLFKTPVNGQSKHDTYTLIESAIKALPESGTNLLTTLARTPRGAFPYPDGYVQASILAKQSLDAKTGATAPDSLKQYTQFDALAIYQALANDPDPEVRAVAPFFIDTCKRSLRLPKAIRASLEGTYKPYTSVLSGNTVSIHHLEKLATNEEIDDLTGLLPYNEYIHPAFASSLDWYLVARSPHGKTVLAEYFYNVLHSLYYIIMTPALPYPKQSDVSAVIDAILAPDFDSPEGAEEPRDLVAGAIEAKLNLFNLCGRLLLEATKAVGFLIEHAVNSDDPKKAFNDHLGMLSLKEYEKLLDLLMKAEKHVKMTIAGYTLTSVEGLTKSLEDTQVFDTIANQREEFKDTMEFLLPRFIKHFEALTCSLKFVDTFYPKISDLAYLGTIDLSLLPAENKKERQVSVESARIAFGLADKKFMPQIKPEIIMNKPLNVVFEPTIENSDDSSEDKAIDDTEA